MLGLGNMKNNQVVQGRWYKINKKIKKNIDKRDIQLKRYEVFLEFLKNKNYNLMIFKLNFFFIAIFLSNFFLFNILQSEETPIIVISAGKTVQSLNTVGSTVTVIDREIIANSSESFLGNIIDKSSPGINMFQMGHSGTNMGIQLRGIEKRYSTIYIDGVKMSDPSSPDNSFYMENIMKNSIDRVEILKGTQSSLYGSGAIAGTINIFTKRGQNGHNSNIEIKSGSNNTNNIFYSVDGANNKIDYFLGLNRYLTGGISARNDDGESDQYRNEGLTGNFSYKLNDSWKIENSLRYNNTDSKYDAVSTSSSDFNNRTDNIEGTYSLQLTQDESKYRNTLSYNKTYVERKVTAEDKSKTNYFGFRDAFNWQGEYNLSLDNKLVYGIDAEFNAARYPSDYAPSGAGNVKTLQDKHSDEHIFSQYFDYQFRLLENLYSTFGLRSDKHSILGRKTSGRTTLAYQLDKKSKIRSSFGAGIRFPALYDFHYADGNTASSGGGSYAGDGYLGLALEDLKAERGVSYDLGYDIFLENINLETNITYFNIKQKNPLVSDIRNNWKMQNQDGVNTTQGVELGLNWKPKDKKTDINFNYTFTNSFDSNTCESAVDACNISGSAISTAKVRVPRHAFTSSITHYMQPNFTNSFLIKFSDETRDFGDTNNSFKDVVLDDYITFDFSSNYLLNNSYNLYFNAINIFDQNYQQAHGYSTIGRTIYLGFKRSI